MNSDHSSMISETPQQSTRRRGLLSKERLMQDIDPEAATWPMVGYCFMTGWIDAIVWSAIFGWPGFQTGSSTQLGLALARLFHNNSENTSFRPSDQLALCSLLTFLFGAFIVRAGEWMGPKTRAWLALGTMVQALFSMASALLIWQSRQPSLAITKGVPMWTNAMAFAGLGFSCASLGLQGIMAKRLNTQFTTTVVLTSAWCELVADPKLFHFHQLVKTRDHKVLAIFSLFVGAFCGRALTQAQGAAVALGVGAGMRVAIAISFLLVPLTPTPLVPNSMPKGQGK